MKIVEYLEKNGPQATNTIQDYLNVTTRHGTTPAQLGNILAKNKEFRKVGTTMKASIISGSYEVQVWGLSTEHV
jgi:hypothetical protein